MSRNRPPVYLPLRAILRSSRHNRAPARLDKPLLAGSSPDTNRTFAEQYARVVVAPVCRAGTFEVAREIRTGVISRCLLQLPEGLREFGPSGQLSPDRPQYLNL